MGWLGWSLTIIGLLIGLISLCTLIGVFIPRDHVATRSLPLKRPPAEVHALITKTDAWPSWWKLLKAVEKLPDRGGHPAVRIVYQDGNKFDLIIEKDTPTQVVTRIDDVSKVFEGTWTYDITPTADGCTVRITEHGTIHPPLVRCMAKLAMDPAMYVKKNLTAQAEHFGEPANIQP